MVFIILIEFLAAMTIWLNEYMDTYDNIITLEDFSITDENRKLNGFMQLHDIPHLINEPTCFQSHHPICIDNIPTIYNIDHWEVHLYTIAKSLKTAEQKQF